MTNNKLQTMKVPSTKKTKKYKARYSMGLFDYERIAEILKALTTHSI